MWALGEEEAPLGIYPRGKDARAAQWTELPYCCVVDAGHGQCDRCCAVEIRLNWPSQNRTECIVHPEHHERGCCQRQLQRTLKRSGGERFDNKCQAMTVDSEAAVFLG